MDFAKDIIFIELFIIFNAYGDYLKIQQGWNIKHSIEGAVQLTVCAWLGMTFTVGIWSSLFLIFFNLCLFWLQFDYLLNWFRGKKWWYLGSNFMDQIFKGFDLRYFRLIFKMILVLISTLIYLL